MSQPQKRREHYNARLQRVNFDLFLKNRNKDKNRNYVLQILFQFNLIQEKYSLNFSRSFLGVVKDWYVNKNIFWKVGWCSVTEVKKATSPLSVPAFTTFSSSKVFLFNTSIIWKCWDIDRHAHGRWVFSPVLLIIRRSKCLYFPTKVNILIAKNCDDSPPHVPPPVYQGLRGVLLIQLVYLFSDPRPFPTSHLWPDHTLSLCLEVRCSDMPSTDFCCIPNHVRLLDLIMRQMTDGESKNAHGTPLSLSNSSFTDSNPCETKCCMMSCNITSRFKPSRTSFRPGLYMLAKFRARDKGLILSRVSLSHGCAFVTLKAHPARSSWSSSWCRRALSTRANFSQRWVSNWSH